MRPSLSGGSAASCPGASQGKPKSPQPKPSALPPLPRATGVRSCLSPERRGRLSPLLPSQRSHGTEPRDFTGSQADARFFLMASCVGPEVDVCYLTEILLPLSP